MFVIFYREILPTAFPQLPQPKGPHQRNTKTFQKYLAACPCSLSAMPPIGQGLKNALLEAFSAAASLLPDAYAKEFMLVGGQHYFTLGAPGIQVMSIF